jgi:hypothetical protein
LLGRKEAVGIKNIFSRRHWRHGSSAAIEDPANVAVFKLTNALKYKSLWATRSALRASNHADTAAVGTIIAFTTAATFWGVDGMVLQCLPLPGGSHDDKLGYWVSCSAI